MTQSPWISIVLLGVAITGYAWMMPKQGSRDKGEEAFSGESAYEQLLEDLEAENRELVDAVAKFKREQDETVDKLNRRIVDMEHQMKLWTLQAQAAAAAQQAVAPSSHASSFAGTLEAAQTRSEERAMPEQPAAPIGAYAPAEAVQAYDPDPEPEEEPPVAPNSIRARYPDLLALHEKGRSVEQIAKALGMNKGEVQLILQLVRREEEHHA